jgi:diketogulonate reductase-like aldo/keto reductase
MKAQGIVVLRFKGLMPLTVARNCPLYQVIAKIAAAHSAPPAAVLLKWYVVRDVVATTTTSKEERLQEYVKAIALPLSKEEIEDFACWVIISFQTPRESATCSRWSVLRHSFYSNGADELYPGFLAYYY